MALAAYRQLLRASRIAFQGDDRVLFAARDKIREEFRRPTLETSDAELQTRIERARGVAQILRSNVVQGVSEDGDVYKLRIHKDTERGDNETIKSPQAAQVGGSCRGGR